MMIACLICCDSLCLSMAGGDIPTQCLLIISSFPFPLLLSLLVAVLAGFWLVSCVLSRDQPAGACRLLPVSEDRTPRRTHIFLSLVVSRMPEHIESRTHVCGSRLDDSSHRSCVLFRCASQISISRHVSQNTSRRSEHFLCSSPSQTTPSTPCATSLEGRQSGYLAESLPHTGNEPNTCIHVSSEHTPISYTWRRNSFNIENDLTTTVAASETF